jgi:septin family protein
MRQLQQELIDRTESGTNYDDLAEEILRLRELQEQTVMDDAAKAAHRERIQELLHFINSQPRTITEFDEALVKKLLESVNVCESFLEFRFKSGVTISIEK